MDNQDILSELNQNTAFKDVTISGDFGASVLQPAYRNEFIREATRNLSIFSEARRVVMNSNVENIDHTGFGERVMHKVGEEEEVKTTKPKFDQYKLIADEYAAGVGITDKALRRNIERQKYAQTLVQMLGVRFGVDWETFAVASDEDKYTSGNLLKTGDGWIKKCKNHLYGTGTGKDFDGSKTVAEMLDTMIKTYPKNYLKQRSSLRFYLDGDYYNEYINEVGERPTIAGDEAISKFVARPFKGIPVVEAPVLSDEDILDTSNGWGPTAMLMDPNNMVYGIFHEVTMEPERKPALRLSNYYITCEVDQGFENPNVGVVAFPKTSKASAGGG